MTSPLTTPIALIPEEYSDGDRWADDIAAIIEQLVLDHPDTGWLVLWWLHHCGLRSQTAKLESPAGGRGALAEIDLKLSEAEVQDCPPRADLLAA